MSLHDRIQTPEDAAREARLADHVKTIRPTLETNPHGAVVLEQIASGASCAIPQGTTDDGKSIPCDQFPKGAIKYQDQDYDVDYALVCGDDHAQAALHSLETQNPGYFIGVVGNFPTLDLQSKTA